MNTKSKQQSPELEDGQGKGRLSEATINYFKRVQQVLMENTFDDEEHKQMFLKNIFNQIEKEGVQLTRHTLTSVVLEMIIPLLNNEQMQKLILLFQPDIEVICSDRFGSHVVETLIQNMKLHSEDDDTVSTFLSICRQIRKLSASLLRDVFGCHVLSCVLQVLSGVQVPDVITKSRTSRQSNKKKKKKKENSVRSEFTDKGCFVQKLLVSAVPDLFTKSFSKFVKVLSNDDNFGQLLCHPCSSPVLQVLLAICYKINKKQHEVLCQSIISRARIFLNQPVDGEDEEDEETIHKLPVVFKDEVGSHLFEAIIQTADEALLTQLANQCFKYYVVSLCIHPVGNYLAQTFLRSITSAEQAEYFVLKLLKYTEDILAVGNMGCIVRISEVIQRLSMVKQEKKFLKAMADALHISTGEADKVLAKLIVSMTTYEVFYKKDSDDQSTAGDVHLSNDVINYHGSCLLKTCFLFKKSKSLLTSFFWLNVEEHLALGCHPFGCIVYEGFFQSKSIPAEKKLELVQLLSDSIQQLACDKFGSRVVDSMWKTGETLVQDRIQNVLRLHKVRLESDLYGRIILYNCGVKQFVNKMKDVQEKKEKKRKLFSDILEEKNEKPPVKKDKKNKNDDRASKYREQLKLLGITIDDLEPTEMIAPSKVIHNENDDLSEIVNAIEATTKTKNEKKKSKSKT